MRIKAPLHVTGFWIPFIYPDPMITGSIGAGLLLCPPATIKTGARITKVNGVKTGENIRKTIQRILKTENVDVEVESPAELGEGFGMSAILSIGLAADGLQRQTACITEEEIGRTAHLAEVMNRTGLGDVISIMTGKGLVVRTRPGPPGIGETFSIPIKEELRIVSVTTGEVYTPKMLESLAGKIRRFGREAMENFLRNETLENFLETARKFSMKTGMLPQHLKEELRRLQPYIRKGLILGYYRKKNVLIIVAEESGAIEIADNVKNLGKTRVFRPCTKERFEVTHNDKNT